MTRKLLLCILFASSTLFAAEVDVLVTPNVVSVGDRVAWSMSVVVSENEQVVWPVIGDRMGVFGVEQVVTGSRDVDGGRSFSFFGDLVLLGKQAVIPTQTIGVVGDDSDSLVVDAILLEFDSLLDDEIGQASFKSIKPLLDWRYFSLFWVLSWLSVLLVIVGAGVWWFFWYRRRVLGVDGEVVDDRPPIDRVRDSLQRLMDQRLYEQGELKQHYVRLTEILKQYFSEVMDVPMMDMTTYEVLRFFDEELDAQTCRRLAHVFSAADRVKFAKYHLSSEEHVEAFQRALIVVERVAILGSESNEEPAE